MSELEFLSNMEYPGRFIALGANRDGIPLAVYGITGRSPSSQARRLVFEGNKIMVKPTDEQILAQGDPSLLIYPAMIFSSGRISISNGAQTQDLAGRQSSDRLDALTETHNKWNYEPDAPNFTPRISGIICRETRFGTLGMIRKDSMGRAERNYFDFEIHQGLGKFISTYDGPNTDPLPPFNRLPVDFATPGTTVDETAQAFYDAIKPLNGNDIRVAVAVAYLDHDACKEHAYINRHNIR